MTTKDNRSITELQVGGDFEAWREHTSWAFDCAPMYSEDNIVPSPLNGYQDPFSGRTYFHEDGLFCQAEYNAIGIDHARRHLEMTQGLVYLGRYPRGGIIANDLGRLEPPHPGAITIFDYAKPFQEFHTRSVQQNVYFRKSSLGLRDTDSVPTRRLSHTAPLARLLNAQMDKVFDGLLTDQPTLPEDTYLQLVACLQLAINPFVSHKDTRRRARNALFEVICDFIRENIQHPNLGSNLILSTFGVSRASLYRMFAISGGVERYITRVRMIRAAIEISVQPSTRGQITKIVEKWGFSSNAHFSRLVRNAFGVAPGSLFLAPVADVENADDPSSLLREMKPYLVADAI